MTPIKNIVTYCVDIGMLFIVKRIVDAPIMMNTHTPHVPHVVLIDEVHRSEYSILEIETHQIWANPPKSRIECVSLSGQITHIMSCAECWTSHVT